MSKRSFIIAIIFSSIFGGIVAVVGFSIVTSWKQVNLITKDSENPISLTNYVFDSSDFVVPEGLNFVFASKKATPSVVHIKTTYTEGTKANSPFNEFFRDRLGGGSGVIISYNGYVITNNHVIDNADHIKVVLNDNRSYEAKVIGTDKNTDLAVLKIQENNLIPIDYGNSDNINVGEWVLAIGNPYEFRSTVTAGIVSAKGRSINILDGDYRIESFIQTDAAVNPGNSGGALVDLNGKLVGINTAIASPSGVYTGYSFAVPVSLVKKVVNDIIEYGTVQRAFLGIKISDVNDEVAEEHKLNILKGIFVNEVIEDNAADRAGIEDGDVIIAIDNTSVTNVAQLQEQIAVKKPGDKVEVQFIRNGKKKTVHAKLRNQEGTLGITKLTSTFNIEGITFMDVSDDLKEQLAIEDGVQIKKLENKKWKEIKIKENFIITSIDNKKIRNIRDIQNYFKLPRMDGILIEGIYPDGIKAHYGLGL